MSASFDDTFRFDPRPDQPTTIEEGVTTGWVVRWDGTPGPAKAIEVQLLTDGEGISAIVPTGEWRDVNVVDDEGRFE